MTYQTLPHLPLAARLRNVVAIALTAAALAAPERAQAFFSTMDTGEVTGQGKYKVTLEPQFITNNYDGFNLSGRFATGVADDSAVEALVGFGEVDFQIGGFYKWVPFPDVEGQPAIGAKAGVLFARVASESSLSVRLHPFISKKIESEVGDITPYVSLPIGITSQDRPNKDDTFFPVQLAVGTEWKTLNYEQLRFMGEIGLDLNDAFPYISFGLVYLFDEEGLRGRK